MPVTQYRFEARNATTGAVLRGTGVPLEDWFGMFGLERKDVRMAEGVNGVDLVRAERRDGEAPRSDVKMTVPAHGTAVETVELPFKLPPGRWSLCFTYDYFLSPERVPPGWFTGTAAAAAIEVESR